MATTLFINPLTRDLDIDADGNIAVATGPYQLAQDAASAIKTFAGEVFYDTSLGIPYLSRILGRAPAMSLIKSQLEAAALTVPGVTKAIVYITRVADRTVSGQVHISDATGATAIVGF